MDKGISSDKGFPLLLIRIEKNIFCCPIKDTCRYIKIHTFNCFSNQKKKIISGVSTLYMIKRERERERQLNGHREGERGREINGHREGEMERQINERERERDREREIERESQTVVIGPRRNDKQNRSVI